MSHAQEILDVVTRLAEQLRSSTPSEQAGSVPAPALGRSAPLNVDALRPQDLAPFIDHTLLKAEATEADVVKLAQEARTHGFATVCVNAAHVAAAARVLEGSRTLPIAVVGFPLGATFSSAKAFEAREAVRAGAREIDMVLNVGALKGRDYARVGEDIRAVVEASRPYPVKVILETSLLTREEKIAACVLSRAAGAAFVKTSTGFSSGGLHPHVVAHHLAHQRDVLGGGASASVAIITGQKSTGKY